MTRACSAAALLAGLALCGCAGGGFSLEKAEVDRSLLTNSVSSDPGAVLNENQVSDEATIRNAVSSADLTQLGSTGLSWANSATGSRGAITNVLEYREKEVLCRRFNASRESYDGVALYRGDACLIGQGLWRMRSFAAL